jgi:hypothetical protein
MTDPRRFLDNAVVARAADGGVVVVLHLDGTVEPSDLQQLEDEARKFNARAIWVFGGAIDEALGFTSAGGYVRLRAQAPPAPLLLPTPPRDAIRDLQTTCFAGIWGRYEAVSSDRASGYVGLYEKGRWVGICQVDLITRWIDGPGVHPMLRTPDRSADLVRGAAAYLPRNRPVTLETWGESGETIEAYRALGFEVMEEVPGWELRL